MMGGPRRKIWTDWPFSKSKSLPAVAETSLPFASELYYVHMYEQYTRHICNNGLFYYFLIVLCDYQ